MSNIITCHILHLAGFDFDCCVSCHEDDDEGYTYSMNEQYPDMDIPGRRKKSMFWAHVCCEAPRLTTVSEWAKAAKSYRKEYGGKNGR